MMSLLTIIALGFFLGMRHATDPDHVIAVSTIVTSEHNLRRSAWIGAAWGVGHTLTILGVGGSMILSRVTLPPRAGLGMELAVGIMLMVLGFRNLGLIRWPIKRNELRQSDVVQEIPQYHSHGDYVHAHPHPGMQGHPHDPQQNPIASMDRWFRRYGLYQLVRPLLVGVVHGLAGSAAIALLVLSTIHQQQWAVAYLAVFGAGTVFGMMLVTLMISSTFAYGRRRFASAGRHLSFASGLLSVAVGLFMAYQIGFDDGIFSRHVHWLPH